ncbi:hypothetical protein [Achromobacter sp. 2789STDY5608628]|uniref:hypothetical protein n=1 Tax=Achromobacter sp. 2789STDY5608628 TaxID=1806493 RepID=UPI0006BFBF9F|nr:hypothetical protein [Achromobacter sp. 2789STDY5608628]CUJ54647.1 Uncharacterised protein [Achromobacter sp. 2789STDY5608628]
MNTDQDGGNAFPIPGLQNDPDFNGMSLRDYFAAKAMQGLITTRHPHHHGEDGPAQLAGDAYLIADAMLHVRGAQ